MIQRRLPAEETLAFADVRGPVVAVCGLTGGAGTTTLAWLLAHGGARASTAPVLLAELPAASGGIAALTGSALSGSLWRLVASMAAGEPARPAPGPGPDGLRVLASGPEAPLGLPPDVAATALADALAGLRREHGLVVLDCGALHAPEAQAAVAAASHIVWVVPAGHTPALRAQALLGAQGLAPLPGDAREVLVVVGLRAGPLPPHADRIARAIARERCERLVLTPHIRSLAGGRLRSTPPRLSTALAAIGGVLQLGRPASDSFTSSETHVHAGVLSPLRGEE